MNDDTDHDLAMLRAIHERTDADGCVDLNSSEMPLFMRHLEWLRQQGSRYRLTDQGRAVLGLPARPQRKA